MRTPNYAAWLARDAVRLDEAVYLVLDESPPNARPGERPTREHQLAEEWIRSDVPVTMIDFGMAAPVGDGAWREEGVHMIELLDAIEREALPRAFGAALLAAARRAPDARLSRHARLSPHARRVRKYRELRDSREAAGWTVEKWCEELCKRWPEVFDITEESCARHFWPRRETEDPPRR